MSDWKEAVHRYVSMRNRVEVDCSTDPLTAMLDDDGFVRKLAVKRSRLEHIYHERNIEPIRQETRMMIEQSSPVRAGVAVDLLLKRTFVYEQNMRRLAEERLERERLTLREERGNWKIAAIHIEIPETHSEIIATRGNNASSGKWNSSLSPDEQANRSKSHPYINRMVLDSSRSTVRRRHYNREAAVHYANLWWDHPNPEYTNFQVNCTNFVSQCLYAGNAPMTYTGKRESGWWYRHEGNGNWSFSWSVANSMYWYLAKSTTGLTAKLVDSPSALEPGDVILYDWNGDGRYQHSVVVTAMDGGGMPLVNANTTNSKHRYWDYRDSYAWSERTKYRFFHISDVF